MGQADTDFPMAFPASLEAESQVLQPEIRFLPFTSSEFLAGRTAESPDG
jgi:hypothetical protein